MERTTEAESHQGTLSSPCGPLNRLGFFEDWLAGVAHLSATGFSSWEKETTADRRCWSGQSQQLPPDRSIATSLKTYEHSKREIDDNMMASKPCTYGNDCLEQLEGLDSEPESRNSTFVLY